MANKSFIIVDGFALIFRAYYAFINNPLRTSEGKPTSALFGFLRMLMKVIKDFKPDYIVIALESVEKTFRSEIFPDYKANRAEPPDELKIQIPLIMQAIQDFQFPAISVNGYEADDVIATLVTRHKAESGLDIFILTGDKDLMQLVGDNVKCITSAKGISDIKIIDREGVKEKFGVYPEKIMDYLTLTGDSVDNIPGVKGIGPKTAVKLLEDFGSVDEIVNHIDRIKGKIKDNIARSRKDIELSARLVRLETEIHLKENLPDFIFSGFHQPKGMELLEKYELHSLLKDPLFGLTNIEPPVKSGKSVIEKKEEKKSAPVIPDSGNQQKGKYTAILTRSALDDLIQTVKKAGLAALDTETDSEHPVKAKIIGASLSIKSGEGFYIPLEHKIEKEFDNEYALRKIKEIAEDPNIKIIGQNIKYDYIILKNVGITINNVYFDTLVASYVLDSSRPKHNMDYLAEVFLGYTTVKYTDLVDTKKGQTLLDVEFSQVVEYAAEDADITFRLYEIFSQELEKNKLSRVFFDIDMPVVPVLAEMEMAGVKINEAHMKNMSETFGSRLQELEKSVYQFAGYEFNVNSTQQLSKVLFETLKLNPTKKTKTGFSTDSQVLEDLQGEHPIIDTIIEYRKLAKLKSTYLDALPPLIYQKTGRIHASFNQIVTATGRLSSSDPNMQNIPIRGETGSDVRQCFIPEEGYSLISADYSQIELRILAHVTADEMLVNAYGNNADIHQQTASLIYDVKPEEVTQEMRSNAKTVNFAVIYGRGAKNLAKDLKITVSEAQNFRNRYFEKYSGVREYVELVHDKSREAGFVKTLFGRIRYLGGFDSGNQRDIAQAERMAFNTIIQGTAADIIKMAMKKVYQRFQQEGLKPGMIIQVHDELVFEIPDNKVTQARAIIKEEMENVVDLSVPLTVNIGAGKNWDEAH